MPIIMTNCPTDFVNLLESDCPDSIRTGETAFDHVYKYEHFQYLERHSDAAGVYNQAMASFSMHETAAILEAYDFSRFRKIVDVGGGKGLLLASSLETNPTLLGNLYDLSQVVAYVWEPLVTDHKERCEVIGGDFLLPYLVEATSIALKIFF